MGADRRREDRCSPRFSASSRDGAGGERFVASPAIVEAFAAHFPRRITLGGTCVRAALAMDRLGLRSTVHLVSIDDHVRRLLPDTVGYLCSAADDSTEPHLIIQFGAGAGVRVGDTELRSPHPNRVILVNDLPNELLALTTGWTTWWPPPPCSWSPASTR